MNSGVENLSPEKAPARGLAIASLVLGIVGLCLSLFVLGGILGLAGLALGAVHILRKRGPNGMAWWGVSLSVLSIIAGVGFGFAYYAIIKEVKGMRASMSDNTSSVTEWEGVAAPDITLSTLDGQTIRLSELKGKRVGLDFWATWCGPCVREIPEFIRLRKETSSDELAIVGVSEEDAQTLKAFVKKQGVNYPIASAKGLPEPFNKIEAVPTTFFIDRKGIIQSVAVGSREYGDLKENALTKDYSGAPRSKPAPALASGLKDAEKPLTATPGWSTNLPGATVMCSGDWDGGRAPEILVLAGNKLHVLSVDGMEKKAVVLPGTFSAIECGRHNQKGARLVGYSNWGRKISVVDTAGKEIWSFSALMGVNGAHWGDLEGDGTDELVIGMNGFGGLDAVSAEGKKLWHVSLGNVWGQAVIPAGPVTPALVCATEAGGSVRLFDAHGGAVRTLRPQGCYCTKLAACFDASGTVQLLALGQRQGGGPDSVIAFDSAGQVAWSSPVSAPRGWVGFHCAAGDLNGDSKPEWVFLESPGTLVVATTDGKKLASIPGLLSVNDFVIVPDPSHHGILAVLQGATLRTYTFQ